MKKALILIIIIQFYCISYPSKIEKMKSQRCVEIYHSMVQSYQITRGAQIYMLQNSIVGFFMHSPSSPFYFIGAPIMEIVMYFSVERPNRKEWEKEQCE